MAYETDHEFEWVLRALPARAAKEGGPAQELPHQVSDVISPHFDSFGWLRHRESVFEVGSGVNVATIVLATVPSGRQKLYTFAHIRAAGVPAGVFWLAIDDGTNSVAVSQSQALVNGEAGGHLVKPIVVPAGFHLEARSEQAAGVGVTMFIEAFAIEMNQGEYILAS